MRSVAQLLSAESGRQFLADRGIFCDAKEFAGRLNVPENGALALDRPYPVYVCQQTQIDYPGSVVSKFLATTALCDHPGVAPFSLWMDTDHAKTAVSTIVIRSGPDEFRGRVISNRFRNVETRFLGIDPVTYQSVLNRLGQWLDQRLVRTRLERLQDSVAPARTLAEANLAMSEVMLAEHLDFAPPSILVSQVTGMFESTLDRVLNSIDDFIKVFNDQIAACIAADIDPRVHTLPDDYLPLHFSCPNDGLRRRLAHRRDGAEHLAVADCRCGSTYRFPLGTSHLSAAELTATGRWSVDVTLPLFVDGLVSGAVVGRSSALYGLVLNEVATAVLGINPVPLLVPADLPETVPNPDRPDSVLYDYLTAP
jgi:hypothetical protein